MTAIFTTGKGDTVLRRIGIPHPSKGEVLVKVAAAAQNPTDWKTILNHQKWGAIVGVDFAGTVVEIHSDVPAELDIKIGDRVAGMVHGSVKTNGTFAEYTVALAHMLIKLPEAWSFELGAQLANAAYTAWQCLYQSLKLTPPNEVSPDFNVNCKPAQNCDILIWGGSTAVGMYAIQLAKLSGMRVITTTSQANSHIAEAMGADAVFDYTDAKAGEKIRIFTRGTLRYAVDCISESTTPFQVSNALSNAGGTIAILNPYVSRKTGVEVIYSLGYTFLVDPFTFPTDYTPSTEDYQLGLRANKTITILLLQEQLKPIPIRIMPGGLAGVSQGLSYMRSGKVRAEKLIYCISETTELGGITI
ncbi:chaperonin 10-like protein [Mycena galopus ATCC 62051]|nr:chaperonin 10-like protein [Mycena galopus ATCC 62051]